MNKSITKAWAKPGSGIILSKESLPIVNGIAAPGLPVQTMDIDIRSKPERSTNGEPKSKRRRTEKEPPQPKTSLKDLGGIDEVLQELESIAFAMLNPQVYMATGLAPPRGLLLFGPPGCGKT